MDKIGWLITLVAVFGAMNLLVALVPRVRRPWRDREQLRIRRHSAERDLAFQRAVEEANASSNRSRPSGLTPSQAMGLQQSIAEEMPSEGLPSPVMASPTKGWPSGAMDSESTTRTISRSSPSGPRIMDDGPAAPI